MDETHELVQACERGFDAFWRLLPRRAREVLDREETRQIYGVAFLDGCEFEAQGSSISEQDLAEIRKR